MGAGSLRSLGIALGLLALCSCSTLQAVSNKANPETFYKRDMHITVNQTIGDGAIVVPFGTEYHFEVEAKGKLDLFTFTSCHREITREKAGEGGIFGDKKKVRIIFHPVEGFEDTRTCPVELGGYEISRGRHSWGFVDFEHPSLKLQARVKCNGKDRTTNGVSVCQARSGLIQEISFSEDVRTSPNPKCPLDEISPRVYRHKSPEGRCVYAFLGRDSGQIHRHTSLGYEQILVRAQ